MTGFGTASYKLRDTCPDKPLSYPEFTVLCALLSKIGTKKSSPCTWQEIRRRALGYTTEAQMTDLLPRRTDGAKPLSRQQVRTLLDKLDTNNFFARFVVHAGKAAVRSHYSFSMKRSDLAELVAEKFGKRRALLMKHRRQTDREISALHAIMERKKQAPQLPAGLPTASPPPGNHLWNHGSSHGATTGQPR